MWFKAGLYLNTDSMKIVFDFEAIHFREFREFNLLKKLFGNDYKFFEFG